MAFRSLHPVNCAYSQGNRSFASRDKAADNNLSPAGSTFPLSADERTAGVSGRY